MKWTTALFALILCIFISGCEHDIQLSALRQSQWYKKQLEIVNAPKKTFLEPARSLWCGKIVAVQDRILTLMPFKKLSGFSNVKNASLDLWVAEDDMTNFSEGTWIVARTERSLKNQYFVKEYRLLPQTGSVPQKFVSAYEKVLLDAIEHNWHLNVEVLDKGRTLKISNGVPQMTKFYEPKFMNGYTSTRTRDGVFFSGSKFEYIVMDTKGILFDRIRLQNTPGGMVWEKDENDLWHVFRCGYDFDPQAFYEITGESPAITRMIRFPWIRESVGTIAKHPSTIARRDELQKAFDKAGIPGKWEIGDFGSMIFYSDCREFELDISCFFHNGPFKMSGPNPSGFIFSLSASCRGAAPIPIYSHPAICDCPVFYYWKTTCGPGYLAWGNGDNMIWHTWNFEFGDELSNHPEVLAKILQTIQSLPPWLLPNPKK